MESMQLQFFIVLAQFRITALNFSLCFTSDARTADIPLVGDVDQHTCSFDHIDNIKHTLKWRKNSLIRPTHQLNSSSNRTTFSANHSVKGSSFNAGCHARTILNSGDSNGRSEATKKTFLQAFRQSFLAHYTEPALVEDQMEPY